MLPLVLEWVDSTADEWAMRIVHQEFRRHEFHQPQGGSASNSFVSAMHSISLASCDWPQLTRTILYVKGDVSNNDDKVMYVPKTNKWRGTIESLVQAYNDANAWRVRPQSTVDPDWEQKVRKRRDDGLRQLFL
jgi:hypothetical protein